MGWMQLGVCSSGDPSVIHSWTPGSNKRVLETRKRNQVHGIEFPPPGYEPEGREFESLRARHSKIDPIPAGKDASGDAKIYSCAAKRRFKYWCLARTA